VQSSTQTINTTASGSSATNACASRRAGKAAKQPMNPTWVRSTSAGKPSASTRCRSTPGVAKPVHDTVTRWVTSAADRARVRANAARAAAAASGPTSRA
jgi:hypothetical protein